MNANTTRIDAGPVALEYGNMLAGALGGRGIAEPALRDLGARFAEVHRDVTRRRSAGELGFYRLPHATEVVRAISAFADASFFENVVILGIGGSALGTIALRQALLHPYWNELDAAERGELPRLYVLDNIDPTTIAPLLDRLDLARTLFNVVSKSGTTAETAAQFLIVRDLLERAFPDRGHVRHLVFTTDPAEGTLRRIAVDEEIAALPIPPDVGGRFSVLSSVGLLPAALTGIDIEEILAGAHAMIERCDTDRLAENPAGMFAALQHTADARLSAPIHVVMSYSDRLYGIADWFRQLWAESLGKRVDRQGREVFRGPTPVKALGATDQHSQVQLYMEGPFDKTVTFLAVRRLSRDLAIPHVYPDDPALAYLGGHSLGELLAAERQATASALARYGRMNMSVEIDEISPRSLGALLMMLQIATVYAGALYDVDPLDQPGVEMGKRLTYALMGRPGFATEAAPPD
jgi:glucose-6-phosphate isomerase